jgi:two-component system sensor histidine kinase AlgZ
MIRQPFAHLLNGTHTVVDALNLVFLGAINDSLILIAWGFLYVGLKHSVALQRERERTLRAETFAAESRLGALQYQLNPHLFFNTLNAISTLIVERRADEATLMIARLSDFLRTTLRQEAVLVSFAEELAFVGQYLDIELIRFSDRLQVTYDIEADACRAQVPILLLQPLVENAIHHGIATLQGAGSIALTGRVRTERLFVTIENSGSPGAETARTDGGIGLANVRDRLVALYGDQQELRCTAGADGGFRVDIELPFVVASNQRRTPMRRAQTPSQA